MYNITYCTFKNFSRSIHYSERSNMRRYLDFGFGSLLLIFTATIFIGGVYGLSYRGTTAVVTGEIQEIIFEEDNCKFIFLENGMKEPEIISNENDVFFLKFNSIDILSNIQEGSIYTLRLAGWKRPALHQYRNVIEYKETSPNP